MRIVPSLVMSLSLVSVALGSIPVLAQTGVDHRKPAEAKANRANDMTEGEVRKVDTSSGKITIKHGDIKNLNMPGMTMVFAVRDKGLLDIAKAGDKIKFRVVMEGNQMVVTALQKSQ